eukprot:g5896.t2
MAAAAPTIEGGVEPSTSAAADGEAAPSNAAAAVPNNTVEVEVDVSGTPAAAEAVPIWVEPEVHDEDETMANDAAIAERNNQAEAASVTSNAEAASPQNGAEIVAGIPDILLHREVGAVPRGGGGEAQGRQEGDIVVDAPARVLGGEAESLPLTSSAGGADTTAVFFISWLGLLKRATQTIVAAILPGGDGTTEDKTEGARSRSRSSPGGMQRLGAGWRSYPGAILYRRDVGVVEEFGVPVQKHRRELRCKYNYLIRSKSLL